MSLINAFSPQESGGDVKFLQKFLDLDKDDVIEGWENASMVYSASDDEEMAKGILYVQ